MNKDLLLLVVVLIISVAGWQSGDLFMQLLIVSMAGVLCHYFNALNKQIIDCNLTAYFIGAFKSTLASLGGCVVAVFTIAQSDQAQALNYVLAGAAFSVGYLSDSVLNKPPDNVR